MKRSLVITYLLLFHISGWGQKSNDREGVWLRVNQNTILKSKPVAIGYDLFPIERKEKLLVVDVTSVNWLYEVMYRNNIYYVSNTAIETNEELTSFIRIKQEEFNKRLLWVKPNSCILKKHPSINAENAGELKKGSKVLVIEKVPGWRKVSDLENAETENAWIMEEDLSASEIEPLSWEEFRKEEYLTEHKDIEKKFHTAIKNSTIIPGMTREMVKASLGPPDKSTQKVEYDNTIVEIWTYNKDFIRVDLINDLVVFCSKYK